MNRLFKWLLISIILILLLFVVMFISISLGALNFSLKNLLNILLHDKQSVLYNILVNVRIPRVLLGLAIGGALSLSGVILQGLFKNPLVEPYTLGISGGAALGVCIGIVFKINFIIGVFSLPVLGIIGAIGVIVLLYFLNIKNGFLKINGLLLTGVMISFISSSLIMLIMAVSKSDNLRSIIFWMMGSLEEADIHLVYMMMFISFLCLGISYFFCLDLNAFGLGENEAKYLGVNTEKTKRFLFVLTSILTGCSVAISGLIGFVGLVVPHLTRIICGRDYRILLFASYILGAIFLITCDLFARMVIFPMELPVGVITGIIGGILFIYALVRQ